MCFTFFHAYLFSAGECVFAWKSAIEIKSILLVVVVLVHRMMVKIRKNFYFVLRKMQVLEYQENLAHG